MKRIITILLTYCMVMYMLPLSVFALEAAEPIEISSCEDFNNIRNNLNGDYILTQNLDFSTWGNWEPIGQKEVPFTGTFDGNGYVISNLTIELDKNSAENEADYFASVFGYVSGGEIINFGVNNTSIKLNYDGSYYSNEEEILANAGGIVGLIKDGTISNCFFTGDVVVLATGNAFARAGGIAAAGINSTISNCYSNAQIYATAEYANTMVAGIVAWLDGTNVSNCYAAGTVEGLNENGYCYAGGIHSSANTSSIWGIIISYGGTVSNCAVLLNEIKADGTTNIVEDIGYASEQYNNIRIASNSAEVWQQSTYESLGWDFDSIWYMQNKQYPLLLIFKNNSFNEFIYHADIALTSTGTYEEIQEILHGNIGTPSNIIKYSALESHFDDLVTFWETATTLGDLVFEGPGGVIQTYTVDKVDIYTTIIMETLECSIDNSLHTILSKENELIKDIGGILIDDQMLKDIDIKSITNSELEKIIKGLDDLGEEFGESKDNLEFISCGLDLYDNISTFIESVASYTTVLELSNEMHQIIIRMYDECSSSNIYLKEALEQCVEIILAGKEHFIDYMIGSGIASAGSCIAAELIDELWEMGFDYVATANPGLYVVMLSYKAAEFIFDKVTNIGNQSEAYIKVLALLDYENLAEKVMNLMANEFLRLKSESNAKLYLESANLKFGTLQVDAQYALDFWNEFKGSLWGQDDLESIISLINSFIPMLKRHSIRFNNAWIVGMENDYPELFESYKQRLVDSYNLIESIKIACPVNVYVYDSSDNLVAYVVDGTPYAQENISIIVKGDVKYLYFFDSANYKIVCDGYDNGEMSVYVKQYGSDKEVTREVNYIELPVNADSFYNINVSLIEMDNTTDSVEPTYDSTRSANEHSITIINGVSISNDTYKTQLTAAEGETIEISTYIPQHQSFLGWTSDNASIKFEDANDIRTTFVMVDEDITINALAGNTPIVVSFDANGGLLNYNQFFTTASGYLTYIPTPTREGYNFIGWYTDVDVGTIVDASTVFTSNTTVYAHWTIESSTYTVTYTDGVDGEEVFTDQTFNVEKGSATPAFIGTPTRSGYTFTGWTPVVSATVTDNQVYTATWVADAPIKYAVTVNGSYTSITGAGEYETGAAVTISAGTRSGYTFAGWTSSDVNITNKYSNTTTFTMPATDVTVTANWTKDSTGGVIIPTEFSINIKDSDNGKVEASVKYAVPGSTVKLTVTPDEGYELDTLSVKSDRKEIDVTEKNGKYQFTMPYGSVNVTATFKAVNPYNDVDTDDWFYDDVLLVTAKELMEGTGNSKFSPDISADRAMIVTILWRQEGCPVVDSPVDFDDVADGLWYSEAIDWASSNGIVNGYGDGNYGPTNQITREQIMAILNRYAVYKNWTDDIALPMIPQYNCSTWAENNVIWADMSGLLNGLGVDITDMTAKASRAELAAYLSRFVQNVVK